MPETPVRELSLLLNSRFLDRGRPHGWQILTTLPCTPMRMGEKQVPVAMIKQLQEREGQKGGNSPREDSLCSDYTKNCCNTLWSKNMHMHISKCWLNVEVRLVLLVVNSVNSSSADFQCCTMFHSQSGSKICWTDKLTFSCTLTFKSLSVQSIEQWSTMVTERRSIKCFFLEFVGHVNFKPLFHFLQNSINTF